MTADWEKTLPSLGKMLVDPSAISFRWVTLVVIRQHVNRINVAECFCGSGGRLLGMLSSIINMNEGIKTRWRSWACWAT